MVWVGRLAKCMYLRVAASWKKKENSWIFFGFLEAKLEQIRACEGIKQNMLCWCSGITNPLACTRKPGQLWFGWHTTRSTVPHAGQLLKSFRGTKWPSHQLCWGTARVLHRFCVGEMLMFVLFLVPVQSWPNHFTPWACFPFIVRTSSTSLAYSDSK